MSKLFLVGALMLLSNVALCAQFEAKKHNVGTVSFSHESEMKTLAQALWSEPELGFLEDKSTSLMQELLSKRFQEAVNSTDESTAYNIFSGASLSDPNSVDDTDVPQSVIESFMINVERESETELASIHAKVSRPDLFSMPAGEVGFAAGVEYRYESFFDKRSDDLNGTLFFTDLVGLTSTEIASQVLGSSPTPDASGSRNVVSAFAEFAIPLIADLPLIESLDLQVAGRYEDFSDVGSVFKPKFALAWRVNENALFRGAYHA